MYINLITEKSINANIENKLKCNNLNKGFNLDGFMFQGIPFFLRLNSLSGNFYIDAVLSTGAFNRLIHNMYSEEFIKNLKIDDSSLYSIDGSGSSYSGIIDRLENLGLLITPYDKKTYVPTNYYEKKWWEKCLNFVAVTWNLQNTFHKYNKTDEKILKILADLNFKSPIKILDERIYKKLLFNVNKKIRNIDLNYINNYIFTISLLAMEQYFFPGENDSREYEYDISDIESFIKSRKK